MSRVVVAEKVSEAGLGRLRAAGHEVVDLAGAPREKLLEALADADALLVRSATKVDAALLAAAPKLTVVGRAGVGVDNVDVPAASARGVLVLNSPTGNVVSAVEHTFAVLLALLRRIPEAAASMAQGKWEKSKFVGSELAGKTVGIVGLGQVGSRVASRARAFEARVLGHDPFLPAEKAQEMGVPLVPLETLLEQSDVVTLHSTATDKGKPLIGAAELGRMKPTAVLVNVARGSLVDRAALHGGAARQEARGRGPRRLRSRASRPERSAAKLPNVVATPHLGASTVEAQERVSIQTVEALLEALAGAAYVPAVNLPFRGPKDASGAKGWMRLAERTGHFLSAHFERSALAPGGRNVGPAGGHGCGRSRWRRSRARSRPRRPTSSTTSTRSTWRATAASRSATRGTRSPGTTRARIRVTLTGGGSKGSADATLFAGSDARVVEVDGLPLEFRPEGTVVYLRNRDVPGVVGGVGTILGEAGINIADFSLARGDGQRAAAVIAVDTAPPPAVLDRLRGLAAVEEVRVVTW